MKKKMVGPLLGLATVLAVASAAWACTYQPQVFALTPERAPSGIEVVVEGQVLEARSPVQVRWNSAEGPMLGEVKTEAGSGLFSIRVKTPEASPGVYYIVVVGEYGVARAPLTITGAGSGASASVATTSSELWNGFTSSSEAGLSEPANANSSAPGLNAPVAAGLGLLAVGLGGLVAGLALIPRRARRTANGS